MGNGEYTTASAIAITGAVQPWLSCLLYRWGSYLTTEAILASPAVLPAYFLV